MMKIDEIKTIVELMSEHDLSEFRLDTDACQLSISRGSKAPPVVVTQTAPAVIPAVAAPASVSSVPVVMAAPAAPVIPEKRRTIDSPTVGTFYRSSAPDIPPFVKVGDTVTPDTVVCIVEAMKVMNEIKAEQSGVIRELLVDNAQPVEFDQALFVIE